MYTVDRKQVIKIACFVCEEKHPNCLSLSLKAR